MKMKIAAALVITLFLFIYPVVRSLGNPMESGDDSETSNSAEISQIEPAEDTADSGITVTVLKDDGKVYELSMQDYLISVTAAEMPAAFNLEALKAQATAARTYTLYNMLVTQNSNHENAAVCTDHTCCKAYIEPDEMKANWGNKYAEYMNKIITAVDETAGKYLTYNGEVVQAVFHSSSAGMTEDAAAVWNTSLPYLVSVPSPETEENVPNFKTTVTITHKEFVETVEKAFPDAYFADDITQWVGETVNTGSGRVDHIVIGDIEISGTEIRDIFDLRSTCFSLDMGSTDVTFTVTGYGHGVGMSQYGANILAGEGKTYEEILLQYYPGTELGDTALLNIN